MKLKMKLDCSTSFMKVRVWQYYEIVRAWSHSDWSICLDLPSMVTATWKAVNYFTIVDDEGSERNPPAHRFDLSPLKKHKMTELKRLMAEQYFTKSKKKEIANSWIVLQWVIKKLQDSLEKVEKVYDKLADAVELMDIESCDEALEFVKEYTKEDLWSVKLV